MATVRLVNNILDGEVKTFAVNPGISVETLIRECTADDVYSTQMVECYDADTGESFFAPIEDDTNSLNVIAQVNQKDVSLDYEVKENDIVVLIVTPAGGGDVNWGPALGLAVVGAVAGGFIGFGLAGPMGAFVGAYTGASLGFALGFYLGNKDLFSGNEGSSKGNIDTTNLPDVRGAANQPLTDQPFPFVIGKHLTTPFIIGSPWNEITGAHGETNYIHCLFAVGYAPLRLTDFRLGELMLSYNRRWSGNEYMKNVFAGILHGVDDNAGSGTDSGDIVNTWKSNDISIEILQQNPSDNVNYGQIYPYVKVQEDVKANVLFIADGELSGIDKDKSISYKGLGLKNGLRNNPIRFTEQFPKSAKVELDFSSGLYKSRSETDDDESEVKYYQIPMWVAIQWRVYSDDNETVGEDESGVFNDLTWDPGARSYRQYDLETDTYHTRRSWHSFKWINSNVGPSIYTEEARFQDLKAHEGNTFSGMGQVSISHVQNFKCPRTYVYSSHPSESDIWSACSYWIHVSGESFSVSASDRYKGYSMSNLAFNNGEDAYTFTITYSSSESQYSGSINNGWLNAQVFNLESLGGTNSNQDGLNEFRCVTEELDFVQWAEENLRSVGETDAQFMEKFRAYFYDRSNSMKSIEIRVVRISPCYLDQTTSTKKYSAYKYSDIFTWTTLTSTVLDGDELEHKNVIKQKRVLAESDMRKLCIVALKAKTDNTDQLSNTLRKFTCTAQSFSPYYDKTLKKWVPENVDTITKYYKPSERDSEDPRVWIQGAEITKEEFEYDRQHGIKSLRLPGGNTFVQQMFNVICTLKHIDERGRYFIPNDDKDDEGAYKTGCDGTLKYCNNNVASMFLLAGIGPQLGVDALGYTQSFYKNGRLKDSAGDFNLAALSQWYEWAECVTDGSVYNSAGYHYDHYGVKHYHEKYATVEMYFTANAYIYQQSTLESILSKIAIAGRAVYTRDQRNRLTVVIDKPEKYPVALINQQNTLKSSYTLSYAENPAGMQIAFPDENDGYNTNTVYCMVDGEDPAKTRSAIEPYKFDFVTNNIQLWGLGRYLLANRVMNKEIVVKKIGIEGASIGLGNLVLVQDDLMLIGTDTGGRITELIEDTGRIYGFIVNNTYKYTGETDGSGRCKQGVVVMQPLQYKESRVITIRLAEKGRTVTVNDKTYKMKKGNTNLVLFDSYISKMDDSIEGDDIYVYKPAVENLVGFGNLELVTSKYRVIKIKPDAQRNYEWTLLKYQEDLYNYGDVLPSFQNDMTIPDRSKEDSFALSNNATYADLVRALAEAADLAKGKIDDTFGFIPPAPELRADVSRDSIQFTSTVNVQNVNNIDHIRYEIIRADGSTVDVDGGYTAEYFFNRIIDQYPERDELELWRFRAKAISIYTDDNGDRYESEWSTLISLSETSLNAYGTWIPPKPGISKFLAGENGIDSSWVCDLSRVYGAVQFEVYVYYDGVLRTTATGQQVVTVKSATYQFDRSVDGYPEKPGTAGMTLGTLLLNKYSVLVRARNVMSGKFTDSDMTPCDYSRYKTWIPQTPNITSRVSNRNVTLYMSQAADCYGLIEYLVGVRRYDDDVDTFYVPDLEINPYSRESAYKLYLGGVFIVGKAESESQYSQTMPLETQNGMEAMLDTDESEEIDKALAVPVERDYNKALKVYFGGFAPIDTTYQFEVYAFNKSVEAYYDSVNHTNHNYNKDTYHKVSLYGARKSVTALATSVQDVLNGSIISDKIAEGAITEVKIEDDAISAPKIQANAVVADKIYAYNLLTLHNGAHAVSGYAYDADNDVEMRKLVGKIKSGAQSPTTKPLIEQLDDIIKQRSNNYWIGLDSEYPEFYMGSVKVSEKAREDANYFHYYYDKCSNSTNLDIKLSNFIVTAVSSTVRGFFNVRNKYGTAYSGANSFLQVNPESSPAHEDTIKGYYFPSCNAFYEDSQGNVRIEPNFANIYEDVTVSNCHQYYKWNGSSFNNTQLETTERETVVLKGDLKIDRKNFTGTAGSLTVLGTSTLSGGITVNNTFNCSSCLSAEINGGLNVTGASKIYGKVSLATSCTESGVDLLVGDFSHSKDVKIYGDVTLCKNNQLGQALPSSLVVCGGVTACNGCFINNLSVTSTVTASCVKASCVQATCRGCFGSVYSSNDICGYNHLLLWGVGRFGCGIRVDCIGPKLDCSWDCSIESSIPTCTDCTLKILSSVCIAGRLTIGEGFKHLIIPSCTNWEQGYTPVEGEMWII